MSMPIEWDARAEKDADLIFDWLEQRSPAGADHWHTAMGEAISKVAADPSRFPLSAEGVRYKHGIHEALFGTSQGRRYRLLFMIGAAAVRVIRVRGPGQRPLRKSELGI